jgi:hypothetical protein
VDINPRLVDQLVVNARQYRVAREIKGETADVLTTQLTFPSNSLSVALHACGELSDKIVTDFALSTSRETLLIVVPCCYNRFRATKHLPWLSRSYQGLELVVNAELLRNLTSQVRGEPSRQDRLMRACHHKRLVKILVNQILDQLSREGAIERSRFQEYSCGGYVAVPDACHRRDRPGGGLKDEIDAILRHPWFGIDLDWSSRIDLVDHQRSADRLLDEIVLFEKRILEPLKRLIELMIIEDRLLFLREHGCQAEMTVFTGPEVTPRNVAIIAFR